MAINPKYLLALGVVVLGAGTFFALRELHSPAPPPPPPALTAPSQTVPVLPATPLVLPQTGPSPTPPATSAAVVVPSDCLLPGPPPVPPYGATASAADMKLGHDVIQNFVVQLEAYQACRNSQADNSPASVSNQQKQTWLADGNAAVDEANALADAFSAQLKAFKAKHPGS